MIIIAKPHCYFRNWYVCPMRITNKIRQDVYLTGKRSILSNLPLPSILNFRFIYANLTHAQSLCLCLEITNLSGDILLKNPVSGLFTHVTPIFTRVTFELKGSRVLKRKDSNFWRTRRIATGKYICCGSS